MPVYVFQSVDKENFYTDIFYPYKDAPKIGAIVEHEGKKWRRIPTMPYAAQDTRIDPNSASDFVKKTGQMKGTYGQMLDYSAEMSAKRAAKNNGIDPVKEKVFEERKKLTGLEHPEVKRRKAKENLAKKGVILE